MADTLEQVTIAKVAWRILPFLFLMFIWCLIDRVNLAFASLTMNADLGFTSTIYSVGASIFFVGYCTFEVPSNLLLERYGASQLDAAIIEALERDVPHPNVVRLALERRRDGRQQAPPVALTLPAHVQARDKAVRAHSLEIYDQLKAVDHEEP